MPKNNEEGADLYAVIRDICNAQRDLPSLNPISLATEAMHTIHFERELHDLGYIGCHLQFRQIARAFCRNKFDPVSRAEALNAEPDLFPETLQERYPLRKKAGEEAEYRLLELLTDEDASYNIERMRRASLALQKHSDALEAFILNRRHAA